MSTLAPQMENAFEMVFPTETLKITEDDDDNRVIEAAIEEKCEFIITGDYDLLKLKSHRGRKI